MRTRMCLLVGLFVSGCAVERDRTRATFRPDLAPPPAGSMSVGQAKRAVRGPLDARGYLEVGAAYYRAGRFQEAIAEFEPGIATTEPSPKGLYYLGESYLAVGDDRNANRVLKRLTSMSIPRDTRAASYRALGRSWWCLGDYKSAVAAFQTSLRYDPRQSSAYVWLGQWAARNQRYSHARQMFNSGLRWADTPHAKAQIHEDLGRLAEEQGDYSTAIVEYREALKFDPGYEMARQDIDRLLDNRRAVKAL